MAPFGSALWRRLRDTASTLLLPALSGLVLASAASSALAQERLALILTSGPAQHTGITETVATELEQGLESHGFDVIRRDGSQWSGLISALALFEKAMEETETALVIYVGETAVWEGRTFLTPAQSSLESANDVLRRATMLNFAIETAGQARLQSGVLLMIYDDAQRERIPGLAFGEAILDPWLVDENLPSTPTVALAPPSDKSTALRRLLDELADPQAGIASLAIAVSNGDADRHHNLAASVPFAGGETTGASVEDAREAASDDTGAEIVETMAAASDASHDVDPSAADEQGSSDGGGFGALQPTVETETTDPRPSIDASPAEMTPSLAAETPRVDALSTAAKVETSDAADPLASSLSKGLASASARTHPVGRPLPGPFQSDQPRIDPSESEPLQGLSMARPDVLGDATVAAVVDATEEPRELSARERERIDRRKLEATLSLEERREIEAALDGLGVFFGVVDGDFDVLTRSAIRQLQILNDAEPVGYLSASEIKRLMR